MNVTGSTGEGEEARQRASLFSSTADFAFGVRGGGSGNNMSELGGTWGDEGVVGVKRPGIGFWRVFKEERVWVLAGKKYSGIVDTCHGEHQLETVQV